MDAIRYIGQQSFSLFRREVSKDTSGLCKKPLLIDVLNRFLSRINGIMHHYIFTGSVF
jgi:hypothetical protein